MLVIIIQLPKMKGKIPGKIKSSKYLVRFYSISIYQVPYFSVMVVP